MFTTDYRKEGEHVLESYIRHSGREWIVSGYLTHVSYGIFVKEYTMSPFVKNCLLNAYMQKWMVNEVCYLALFKELSREKSRKEALLSKRASENVHGQRNGIFFLPQTSTGNSEPVSDG